MSIFKDTFRKGTQDQLTARQEALLKRTPSAIQYYNSRNAWIRMTSATEVNGDRGYLAKKYILQGGILTGGIGTEKGNLRSGLAGKGFLNEKSAYSNASIGDNNTPYRLGIRPMPGITDIDVKSKGTYGSLREVTVNFDCWDIRQLEDLELLYMRPGYSVLVEWGWTPYLKNDGTLEANIEFIDDVVNANNNYKTSKDKIFKKIYDKSIVHGNYDAAYGIVKNYSWKAKINGGYDCTISIASVGDVLESLKVNYSAADSDRGQYGVFLNKEKYVSEAITNIVKAGYTIPFSKESDIGKAYTKNVLAGLCAELYTAAKANAKGKSGKADDIRAGIIKGAVKILSFGTVDYNPKIITEDVRLELGGDVYHVFRFDVDISNQDSKTQNTLFTETGEQIYITLGDFIYLLNKYILLQDTDNDKPFTEVSLKEGDHMENPGKPLLCLGSVFQISTDPTVCMIKNKAWLNPEDLGLSELSNESKYLKEAMINLWEDYWYEEDYKKTQLGVIQNIYVNLAYIYSLSVSGDIGSQDKMEKNSISLFELLKNMMNGINKAIGNIANFDVYIDPQDNKTRIIDINYTGPSRSSQWDRTYELQIHNTKSTVRSYTFESKMFNEQSTQVAIAAQNGGEGALAENVETLVDFNQNLEDRIVPRKVSPFPLNKVDEKTALENKIKNLKESIDSLSYYVENLNPGDWETTGDFDAKEAGKYANALKDTISFFNILLKSDNKNRAILPTTFSCELDGIGGITIGHLFKLPQDMIPRGYKGLDGVGPSKMAYVVTGISHRISGVDWTTSIDAQVIILDEPKGTSTIDDIKKIVTSPLKVTEKTLSIGGSAPAIAAAGSSTAVTIDANGNPVPNTPSGPLIIPAGAAGNAAALQAAGDAIFRVNGGRKSRCAQYTYHIAYYYIQALKGINPSGQFIGGHGNAGDAIYRTNLQKLGYKMTTLGVLTKDQVIQYVNQIKTVGTIINYRATNYTGGNNYATIYGHTQIYTGGLLKTSNGSHWASSFGNNYGTGFVYNSKPSNSWESYIFTL